jgi:thiol-disulfide isomerase/thioredoxin
MGTAALVARLLLAAVFVIAAAGKLLDVAASRKALVDFGVPRSIANPGGVVLPLAELATAVALLIRPSAPWGAAAALVLLAGFIAGMSRALARGEAPDCHCFGTIHSEPVGRSQIARNVALGAVAVVALVAGPGPAINGWSSAHGASQGVVAGLAVAVVALVGSAVHFWNENRRLRSEVADAQEAIRAIPPGLPAGSLAPSFAIPAGAEGELTLEALRAGGRPIVLIFTRPGCGPCATLSPELAHWRDALRGSLTVGVVGLSQTQWFVDEQERLGLTMQEVMDRNEALARETDEVHKVLASYRVQATPSAVIVTPEGTIASATVDGRLAIEALIRLTLAGRGVAGRTTARVAAGVAA